MIMHTLRGYIEAFFFFFGLKDILKLNPLKTTQFV
jgi:hypothetical protein